MAVVTRTSVQGSALLKGHLILALFFLVEGRNIYCALGSMINRLWVAKQLGCRQTKLFNEV